MEIKSKGVCNIPSGLRAKLVQLKGEVSDDLCGESYLQDQDLLRQLPGAIHTFKRGSYASGGQETRGKRVLVFTYLPFPQRDERARALQTSISYHSQSSVLSVGDRCSREASCHQNAGEMRSLDTWRLENPAIVRQQFHPC